MRAPQPQRRPRRIRNRKRLVLQKRRVFRLVGNIVTFDTLIRHLRVKIRRVAQRSYWVDTSNCAVGGVLPGIDGVGFTGRSGGVGVFPPEFDIVGTVSHHGVGCRTFSPAVAADAGVRVEAGPLLDGDPGVLPVVPGVL